MANQELKVWAKNFARDPVKGNQQRRPITDEEFLEGWPQSLTGVSAQQMNQMYYLLSSYCSPSDVSPYLHLLTIPIPSVALEVNGQSISQMQAPELFAAYGGALPDLTGDAPAGWTYLVRLH